MKLIQIVSAEDGRRTPAFPVSDFKVLSERLSESESVNHEDLVLVVMEEDDKGDFQFSNAPLMKVSTVINVYK